MKTEKLISNGVNKLKNTFLVKAGIIIAMLAIVFLPAVSFAASET